MGVASPDVLGSWVSHVVKPSARAQASSRAGGVAYEMAPACGWQTGVGCWRGISVAVQVGLSRGLPEGPHNMAGENE